MKKFKKALRPDLKVQRTGILGLGRTLVVSGGGVSYRIDRARANATTADLLNSKIPAAVMRPPA